MLTFVRRDGIQQVTTASRGFTKSKRSIQTGVKDETQWEDLCRQAAVEQDPKKLLQLVTEINRQLAEKQRLGKIPKPEEIK